jgi:DNA-directed RNA polymerase specialized sigma24 family protein
MKTPIEILASETWPAMVCKKYSPAHWKDLQQELFLLIATELSEKAARAHEAGYFEFFYIRCAANLCKPNGTLGSLNIGTDSIEGWDVAEEEDEWRERKEADVQEKLDAIAAVQSREPWYESKMMELYLSGMSMRKIHRLTGIALNEVSRVINDFRAKCREEYL